VTGSTGRQVGYLAGLADRAAPRPPRRGHASLPELLQPPRPLFGGAPYRLDHVLDPGLGPQAEDTATDTAAGSAAGGAGATASETGGFPPAGTAGPTVAARPAPTQPAQLPGTATPETGAPAGRVVPPGKPTPTGHAAVLGPGLAGPRSAVMVTSPAASPPPADGRATPVSAGTVTVSTGRAGTVTAGTVPAGTERADAPGAAVASDGATSTGTAALRHPDVAPAQGMPPSAGASGPAGPSATPLPRAGRGQPVPHPAPPEPHPPEPGRGLLAPPAPGWLWGTPVQLPGPVPVTATPAQAGQPPSLVGTGTRPPHDSQEQVPPAAREPGGAGAAADRGHQQGHDRASDPGQRSAAVRDLMPPAPTAEPPGPGGSARGSAAPARVTIGTIEVTVVPPARPPQSATEPARVPPLPPARRHSASPPAEAGSARLRGGLRRWYGIAQG
jgi:hypothetical protein